MYGALYSSIYSYSPSVSLSDAVYSALSFWDYDLQNGSVNVTEHDLESPGNIQYIAKDRGLSDGATFIDKKTRLRPMTVTGYLIANDRQSVEELADEFKQNIDQVQAYLRFKTRGDTWRQILATATNISMKRKAYHVTKIPFTITFTANDPFFQLIGEYADNFSDISNNTYIDGISNIGSANMGVRAYVLLGTGNTGVTSIAFTANGRTITVTDTFADSDVLLLDMTPGKEAVFLNWVRHDYAGTFPGFTPGNNEFTVTANGTHLYNLIILKTIKYK